MNQIIIIIIIHRLLRAIFIYINIHHGFPSRIRNLSRVLLLQWSGVRSRMSAVIVEQCCWCNFRHTTSSSLFLSFIRRKGRKEKCKLQTNVDDLILIWYAICRWKNATPKRPSETWREHHHHHHLSHSTYWVITQQQQKKTRKKNVSLLEWISW